ncbi:MAG: hypothetical protein J6A98_03585 [Clostridia bacterium]|nr:hypothetical protein [Clostridia bacterium]
MKKKCLKIFAASGLALIMGAGVLCGCLIPMNSAQANTSKEDVYTSSTSSTGLITPKEDDPILFTTESGLEIKWGNAAFENGAEMLNRPAGTLNSGNLNGFPYFTTNDGTKDYIWVIIGKSINLGNVSDFSISKTQTLNQWQTEECEVTQTEYFFENIYETTTSAGGAISDDNVLKNDVVVKKTISTNSLDLSSVTADKEIPDGCVLCLANDVTETAGVANTSSCSNKGAGWGASHGYHTTYVGQLATTLSGYYTDKLLGLDKIARHIPSIPLTTKGIVVDFGLSPAQKYSSNTVTAYIFTLSQSGDFAYSTYLTAGQAKLSSNWWLRDGLNSTTQKGTVTSSGNQNDYYYYYKYYLNSNGSEQSMACNQTAGYRPAFVLKLL